MASYFIWNGVDCRSMGVKLRGPMEIIRPEERVQHIQIPGRDGDLTITEGQNVYNSYIRTATISVTGWNNIRKVFNWLKGSGTLTVSGEPDRKQAARVIGAIKTDKLSKNLDVWNGEVQFYCQPLKEMIMEAPVSITAAADVINMGDVEAKPLFVVKPDASSGSSISTSTTVNISTSRTVDGEPVLERIVVLQVPTRDTLLYIDCETQMVWTVTGDNDPVAWISMATGVFPRLSKGANYIDGSGWSRIEITKRERFL